MGLGLRNVMMVLTATSLNYDFPLTNDNVQELGLSGLEKCLNT